MAKGRLLFGTSSIFFLLVFCLQQPLLHATDTITANQPLSGDQKLISQSGKFALGFFQPTGGSPSNWYIGIWYNKISVHTPVWVANRDTPVSDPATSQLAILADGNMALLNHSKSTVWSTDVDAIASNSSTLLAVLLDTGNLVLRDASNASAVLWQSFDHFGDTWLPGGKLSRNKRTGVSNRLVAWKDYGDPATGAFSLLLDPNGWNQYILLWNNSREYWATGNWTGHSFMGVPEVETTSSYADPTYTFQFVDNDQETYFTFNFHDNLTIYRFVLDVSGQLKGFFWVEAAKAWSQVFVAPKAKCAVYLGCGPFSMCSETAFSACSCLRGFSPQHQDSWNLGDYIGGCKRNVALQCGSSNRAARKEDEEEDKFLVMNNVRLPEDPQGVGAASARDCERACLNNCSCSAYSYNGSCSVWYAELKNLQDSSGGAGAASLYVRLAASELPSAGTHRSWIIGAAIGGAAVIALVILALAFACRRRKRRIGGLNGGVGSVTAFRYRDLQFVTKNFSEKLGGGSFGSVFKGVLTDETVVAVKKLEGVRQGEKEFRAEVSTIGTIQHVNLIRLLGFCSEGARRLLVYEYMPNGSLDRYLFGAGSKILNWETRYQIAIGIAKGLAYLHEKCRDCIIHCDIKPQNILLDASLVPKVADFGLAKLLGRDFSRVLTTVRGTIGYLAPEWMSGTPITAKADVFSYGMMLFEIISRRRNIGQGEKSEGTFFPVLVARTLLAGEVHTLLDGELDADANLEELERACRVACWCVQGNENSRPTMGEIVQILEGLVDVNMPPIPRHLQVLAEGANYVNFCSEESSN